MTPRLGTPKPRALFDPEGRRKLAAIVVWGSNGARFNRAQIEKRLERALERIAEKVAHEPPH